MQIRIPPKPNGTSEGQWMAFCRDAMAGVSPDALSIVYGKPVSTIYRWRAKLGIKKDAPGSPEATNRKNDTNPVSSTELTSKDEE